MAINFGGAWPTDQMHVLGVRRGSRIAVDGISQANRADLLQRLVDSGGQAPAAAPQNTDAALKIAKIEAQLSEASVVGGGAPDTSVALLNTYA